MKIKINQAILELLEGNITEQETQAIVNAANTGLRGGSGVDGAIHLAGGPQILKECAQYEGCPTGEARITSGGKLKASYVIHTVGPIYQGGKRGEDKLLASAYRQSLALASKHGLSSIAFPSISTGAYGYPLEQAARIALRTVKNYLTHHDDIALVRFVLFGPKAYENYHKALEIISKR